MYVIQHPCKYKRRQLLVDMKWEKILEVHCKKLYNGDPWNCPTLVHVVH
jgi:hypothetical protein